MMTQCIPYAKAAFDLVKTLTGLAAIFDCQAKLCYVTQHAAQAAKMTSISSFYKAAE
jgi:hypothetical protein